MEVAAGLSPRGLAMTEDPDVIYVATDLPHILEQEQAIAESILAKSHLQRSNLYFRIANALDRDELFDAAVPFERGRPIAVITEGLLPYLTRGEKRTLAANISALLTEYGGLWITPDVATKQSVKRFSAADIGVQERMQNVLGATGRDIEQNVFEDEDDMRQFFTDAGYTIEEFPHSNVLEELSAVQLSQLSRDDVRAILQVLQTLILTVQDPYNR